jgi:hypothetical protein
VTPPATPNKKAPHPFAAGKKLAIRKRVIFKEGREQFFSRLACRFARKNHSVADRVMELHESIKCHKKQSRQLANEMERV